MLDEIIAYKRSEVAQREAVAPLPTVRSLAANARAPRDFAAALREPGVSLIAEVKFRSPSKGVIREGTDALDLARTYVENGARAISVLADEHFFGGGQHVVQRVANASEIQVPILFKDFILSTYQIYEARATGADAVLLIVRAVDQSVLTTLIATVHELGMNALVEVFLPEETEQALIAGARIIGINNRNLETFEVNLERAAEIRALIPKGILTVSESGLKSRADVFEAESLGFDGILVGEALLTAQDVGARVRELLGTQVE